MKRIPLVSLSVGLFLSNPWCALGQTAPQISLPVPVDVEIPMPPTPVKADGKWWLVYELHLTNFHTNNVELVRVEVMRDGAKMPMATYTDEELSRRLKPTVRLTVGAEEFRIESSSDEQEAQ